ncbi:hypothetical protein Leryth_008643, partial [Lithospermum erythrorhizon]
MINAEGGCIFGLLGERVQVGNSCIRKFHQRRKSGLDWLWYIHCHLSGGILCDDRGTGKTASITLTIPPQPL